MENIPKNITQKQDGGDEKFRLKPEEAIKKLEILDGLYGRKDSGLTALEKEYDKASGDVKKKHDIREKIVRAILSHTDISKMKPEPDGDYHMNLYQWHLEFRIQDNPMNKTSDVKIGSQKNLGESEFKALLIYAKTPQERDEFIVTKKLKVVDGIYPSNPDYELLKMEKEHDSAENLTDKNKIRQKIAEHIIQHFDKTVLEALTTRKTGEYTIEIKRWKISFSFENIGDGILITNGEITDKNTGGVSVAFLHLNKVLLITRK